MKKYQNKLAGIILLISVFLTALLPVSSVAAGNINPNVLVTLTVSTAYEGVPLSGVTYHLYKVADFKEDGSYTVKDAFAKYPVDLGKRTSDPGVAVALAGYVEQDHLSPDDTGTTGSNGKTGFPQSGHIMYPGIYLLTATTLSQNEYAYETSPLLLNLPDYNTVTHSLIYNGTVQSKTSRTIIEDAKIERSVFKIWKNDSEQTRPSQITVQLLCNDTVYKTAVLSESNNWFVKWTDLPKFNKTNNTAVLNKWSVTETAVSGYTVGVTLSGNVFRITNTKTAVTPTSTPTYYSNKLPQTGLLWWPLPFLIVAGIVCMLPFSKLKKLRKYLSNGFFMVALFLVTFNFAQDYKGYKAAQNGVQQLEQAIVKKEESVHTEKLSESEDKAAERKTAALNELALSQPDYVLNPDIPMPETESEGNKYIGLLKLDSLALELPIISQWSYEALQLAPARYTGSAYQDNMVICAHNYNSHFGRLKELKAGDTVSFTDVDGNEFKYEVTETDVLGPTDIEEMTTGDWDLTLFTCTIGGASRVTVRCNKL